MNPEHPPMPVRRLHNYSYCKRLFYLQWVEDLWVEDADTAAGSHTHRNTDKPSHWGENLDPSERSSLRSLSLESETLGLRGVIDLIENTASGREIIDYKKGTARRDENNHRIAKENDCLQLAAYAMLLAEAGMPIKKASVYYAAEKSRIPVPLTDSLFQTVRDTLAEARALAASGVCPPPLLDDPRCLHCSAYSICLPNESAFWSGTSKAPKTTEPPRPPGDQGEIIVIQDAKAYLGCRGGEIQVRLNEETVSKHPIEQIQAVYLYGAVQTSTQAIHSLLERSIPVAYFSPAGRFLGTTSGLPQSGIDARLGQARLFNSPQHRLPIAREMIRAKIHNQRVLLMRNGSPPDLILKQLADLRDQCPDAKDLDSLRGIEGAAAAHYFRHFKTMLKGTAGENFDFEGRNRRPPNDPLNALLSQGYSILAKELTGICHAVGLDPFIGVFHQPRYGRPALALDLMEEFRPLIADSVALSLLNRQELGTHDFEHTSKGVFMGDSGRRQFWRAWFRRLDTEVKHPQFDYRMSYRRMLDVQTRQLWRYFRGDAQTYYGFTTR
ncbi:CRISPR-associated endonuclease Cas1 [Akkermansiaceae bacterium]|nr:CRISPR-associated endonuclease Cas1 [Akkermansiaceae bacterium]